ncbi:uncharacterized protein KY384_002830 [Bacidia gigantensis]|uniref:uncharacterized protein n=1 Tax=Bacidia gigantensis TaxID=2732470 RepID=UPI001D03BBD6|nr:uncharacterized protein KY384_002830 [Bacidia gigantensis]KAG8532952.1 hypothetical protein KY384_002830 [Bacidia gigantensis]
MNDIPTFNAFAISGNWSGSNDMSLPETTQGLDYMLKTYITSEAMKANSWLGIPGKIVNESAWAAGKWDGQWPGGAAGWGKPDGSLNSGTFRSTVTGRLYVLYYKQGDSPGHGVTPTTAVQRINAYGWANLETLFDGSYNCTASGKAGGSDIIQVNTDVTPDSSHVDIDMLEKVFPSAHLETVRTARARSLVHKTGHA